jgi:maltose O-acetyltransferase
MTIQYLWKNREKPIPFSSRWTIVWLKRIYYTAHLIKIFLTRYSYQLRGAKLGKLTILHGLRLGEKVHNLQVGNSSYIAPSVKIAFHHSVSIGSNVVLNDGVHLLTGSHWLKDPQWRLKTKPIVIDDFAWIATNAIILPGVHVGKGAVVGAGAVVREDVPDYALVTGNPGVVQERCRGKILDYDPVAFSAPYEAWLGKNLESRLTI